MHKVGMVRQGGPMCPHSVRLRIRDTRVYIEKGHLQGGEPDATIFHSLVEYCGAPTCEKVFKAEK